MTIRFLRTFVTVSEAGSFAAAAKRIFLTHAAVSMQIKTLENDLGVLLFDRGHRPPQLTDTGRALLPMAADLVRAFDRLPAALRSSDAEQSHFSFGAIPSSLTGVTPRILSALRQELPDLHINLTSRLSEELIQMIEDGTVDAAFVSHVTEPSSDLEWRPFFREPLALLAPASGPRLEWERLLTEMPFIHFRRSMFIGRLVENLLRSRHLQVREIMTLDTIEAVAAMVANGLGVAIAPMRRDRYARNKMIRIVPLPRPAVYRTLGLVFRSARKADPLIKTLVAQVTDISKKFE
jgi:DNA-binding transcriptional LysR family regulator